MKLIVITGLSGAGKGVALHSFEDMGFEAIDNIPLSFLLAVVKSAGNERNLAIAADVRSRDFSIDHFTHAIAPLRNNSAVDFKLVFLDCDDEVIRRRFTETRRRHPLAGDRTVQDGITHERQLTQRLREVADIVIDTTDLKAADLKQLLSGHFTPNARQLSLCLTSFSYKKGLPREADLVFDVRFLRNPHYDIDLKHLTGLDAQVGAHIEADVGFSDFFNHLTALLLPLLPRYCEEGKQYLSVAIGCTGGQHRSVYTVEKLGNFLREAGYVITVRHRELAGY